MNIFFRCYIFEEDYVGIHGQMSFLNATGMLIFTVVVILANLKMLVFSKTHYNFTLFFIFGSIAFYLMTFYVFNLFSSLDAYRTFPILHLAPYYYLVIWEIVGFTIVIDIIIARYWGNLI